MQRRVLLDGRKIGDGGIGIYIENLVDGMLELADSGKESVGLTVLIPPAEGKTDLQEWRARWASRVELIEECAGKYSVEEYFCLARRRRDLLRRVDLFHSPHYTLPFFLEVPAVVTVHDAIHITHPEHFYVRPIARKLIRSATQRANHVICVSESASQDLRDALGDIETPVTVIPNAVQREMQVLPGELVSQFIKRWSLTHDYCLYVGSERPHKGFDELVDAWEELTADPSLHDRLPDLVVVGERFGPHAIEAVRARGLGDSVQFLGAVSRNDLSLLYNGARALLVPSRIEGFGLPAIEALACGTAVVGTPHPALFETCEDCAWVSRDFTSHAIADAVRQMISQDAQRRDKIIRGLRRARVFTREAVANRTLEVYAKVLGLELDRTREEERHPGAVFAQHAAAQTLDYNLRFRS